MANLGVFHFCYSMLWLQSRNSGKKTDVTNAKIQFIIKKNFDRVTIVVQSHSRVWLISTPWTAAHQVSLSFTISWSLLKLMSIESVMPSNHLILCYTLQSVPASKSFLLSWVFASGGQSTGASALASVLPMNIQGWFPLGLTALIPKGLSRVFSNTKVSKYRFFISQPSLWSSSHICTWLLEKP